MMTDRGFHLENIIDNTFFFTNNSIKVLAFFVKDKICIKKIKEIEQFINTDIGYILLIYNNSITSFAKQAIKTDLECDVQLFTESELSFNVTKHFLVPKHEILSKNEKIEFVKKNKLKVTNIPRIFDNDPVIKYYYGKPGDLVKITRDSETNGCSIYYRIVYASPN